MATELLRLSDLANLSQDDTAQVLVWLHTHYPAFRFLREPVGWLGQRWMVERINGLHPGVHTLITAELEELLGALDVDERCYAPNRE